MRGFPCKSRYFACLALSLALITFGCKSNSNDSQAAADQAASDPNDPANANVVPISNATTAATPAQSSSSSEQASSPSSGQADQSGGYSSNQSNQDNGYGQEPETYAQQPPPELPQYEQPPCPQEGYLWTPGYWAWAQPAGYYWVPGAWVEAPYPGALWTPGYWGWRGGRYAFYRGYWGRHIGYYGGINYGFGYLGFGYQGGYWRGNEFAYNTAVNRVDTMVIRNVYNYRITNITVTRISYNGGSGGVQYRPRPSEIIAIREEHTPPMAAQVEVRRAAQENRETFYNVNRGRPAAGMVVASHPLPADRGVRPPAVVNYARGERPAEAPRATTELARPEERPQQFQAQRPEERRPEEQRSQAGQTAPQRRVPAQEERNRPPEVRGEANREAPHAAPRDQSHTGAQHKPEPQRKPEDRRPQ